MRGDSRSVLSINAGSSSIKFALYEPAANLRVLLKGQLDRIGVEGTSLSWTRSDGTRAERRVERVDRHETASFLIDWLDDNCPFTSLTAVGHRIVHGLARTEPTQITSEILGELRRAAPFAPEHLPLEIELIEALHDRDPRRPQVACFDTAFHASMPRIARLLPIPRRYQGQGVVRYGFHGLSYAYLMEELARVAGAEVAAGRVVLAHLGNGASLAAVKGGRSIDTTMGFTPASGLVMSTRSGDLDPGVVSFLAREGELTVAQFDRMVNHEAGLLGVSELSSDMKELLAREAEDPRAADAVALFCYHAKKWMGAFAAALGGLDTLVFSAGIGERSAAIRARLCEGLDFLGVELDHTRNEDSQSIISTDRSRVAVRIIPTDEELMIARSVVRLLALNEQELEA